jgi:sulfur carrier protein ThiS
MWSNKYIGIPYKDYGRDESGIDCWGLACLVYKQEFAIDLPTFSGEYEAHDRKQLHQIIAQHRESWTRLDQPKAGCLVLFRILGSDSHVGIAVSETEFLHARNGYDSSIETFSSTNWKDRIVGYFEYSAARNLLPVTAIPHPLQTKRVMLGVEYGSTIQQALDKVDAIAEISPELKKRVVVLLNSRVVPASEYSTTVVKQGDTLEYRALPGEDIGRLVLTLVVVWVAFTFAPGLAATLTGTTTASAGAILATQMGITMVGTLLVNAIMPIRPPSNSGPGDPGTGESPQMLSGASNRANPYGSIPFVLGKYRITPPLGAQNVIRYGATESAGIVDNATKSYLDMLLVWGYGPLHIDDATLKIGEVPLPNFDGLRYITLDRKVDEPASDLQEFNAIYGKDREQKYVGIELVCEGLPPVSAFGSGPRAGRLFKVSFGGAPWTPTTTPGPWTEVAFDNPSDKLSVSLHFPQGLRAIDTRSGGNVAAPVKVNLEYKTQNSGWIPWTTQVIGGTLSDYIPGGTTTVSGYDPITGEATTYEEVIPPVLGNTITGGAPRKDGFTWVITLDRGNNWGANDKLTIRARRASGDETEAGDLRYSHTVVLQDATSTRNMSPAVDPKNTKIAKTAITIQATDQLNNQIEGINGIVQTWCLDWTGSAWVERATSNPASLFRYVLQSGANPHRVLDSEVSAKIDLAKLQYWHEYCNRVRTDPETGNTYRYEFNAVVSQQRSVLEVLRDICAAGKASPAMQDGRWTVVIDEPKTTIVQHFSPHNSWGFESTKNLPKLPDALKINFFDESQGYQDAELVIPFSGKTFEQCELFESIQLPGVTNKYVAKDHARWHMAQAKLRPEIYTLSTDIEYIVCNRGDRVKVTHDIPMWGLGSGRIKNRITNSIFDLDESVPVDNAKSYTMRVRSKTGSSTVTNLKTSFAISSVSRTANVVTVTFTERHPLQLGDLVTVVISALPQLNKASAEIVEVTDLAIKYKLVGTVVATTTVSGTVSLQDNYYSRVQVELASTAAQIDAEDLFLYGENQKESQDLIVISIEPIANKSARLTLVDYGVTDTYNIFTDYLTLSSSQVFESQITLPPTLLINSFGDKVPTITSAVSDETVMELISPGVFRYNISLGYTNAQGLPETTEGVEAQIDYTAATDTIGIRSTKSAFDSNSVRFTDVDEKEEYKIRLRYVGRDGRTGIWTDWFKHTVVGKSNPPASVVDFTASISENGGKVLLKWSANLEIDLLGYEVRTDNTNWDSNVPPTYYGPNTLVEVDPKSLLSNNTWYIKAIDTSNNYSLTATQLTYQVPTPNNIDSNTIQAVFADTSLTAATVTVSWQKATSSGLAIAGYRVVFGTRDIFVNATTVTLQADWVGSRDISIITVDILGNESAGSFKTITKLAPDHLPLDAYRIQVIDNNVLLYWALPQRTTLPISHVIIRKSKKSEIISEYSWETAEVVGEKTGTFTSFSELTAGEYIYWIRVVDTDGVESAEVFKTVIVAQPPDFVFNGVLTSDFEGTNVITTNVKKDPTTSNILLPVNTTETWEEHFTSSSWSSAEAQVLAGYPKYIQPAKTSANYTEVFDYGTILASSQATLEVTGNNLIGTCLVKYFLSYSADGITYSVQEASDRIFAVNFRYIKLVLEVTATTPGAVYEIQDISVKLDSKKVSESGRVLAKESDVNGSIVNFNKTFIDISSILTSCSGLEARTVVYDILGTVLYATYTITGSVCTFTVTNPEGHRLLPGQNIRATFDTGGIPIGIYTITSVPSSNVLTFNVPSASVSSGTASFYPNSFRVFVFDNLGTRKTEQVSWAVTGF